MGLISDTGWANGALDLSAAFQFVGRKGHPRDIPAPFMNYMNFVQGRNGEKAKGERQCGMSLQFLR